MSLYRVFAGFAVALLLALPLGILIGMNRRWVRYTEPMLEFIRHIPPLATIPMLILWFGIDETSKLTIIVLATFFPIYLNTVNGIIHCDPKLLEVGRSFGFSRGRLFWRIILPAILPYILIGMRLGLGYSWRSLIGAELIAAAAGIGYMILDAEQLSRPDIIVVGILTIGILGSVIDHAFFRLTRHFTPWGETRRSMAGVNLTQLTKRYTIGSRTFAALDTVDLTIADGSFTHDRRPERLRKDNPAAPPLRPGGGHLGRDRIHLPGWREGNAPEAYRDRLSGTAADALVDRCPEHRLLPPRRSGPGPHASHG